MWRPAAPFSVAATDIKALTSEAAATAAATAAAATAAAAAEAAANTEPRTACV